MDNNPFFSPDPGIVEAWSKYLDGLRKSGNSCGAVIEVVAEGVPPGWGAPIYGKLDQDLAAAMMSINAVKGVEIGAGMAAAELTGEDNADEIRMGNDGKPLFLSNNAGGILGGISSGQPVVCRFAVKPTSSILTPRRTIDRVRQGDRDLDQGPARPLRRHPRGAGRRGDDGAGAGRPLPAPPRAERVAGHRTRWRAGGSVSQRLAGKAPYSYRSDPSVPPFPDDSALLVFDGVCVLCSATARFILKRDRAQRFRFATAQSPLGQALFRHYGLDAQTFETNLVLFEGRAYGKLDTVIARRHSCSAECGGRSALLRAAAALRSPIGCTIAWRATATACSAARSTA